MIISGGALFLSPSGIPTLPLFLVFLCLSFGLLLLTGLLDLSFTNFSFSDGDSTLALPHPLFKVKFMRYEHHQYDTSSLKCGQKALVVTERMILGLFVPQ